MPKASFASLSYDTGVVFCGGGFAVCSREFNGGSCEMRHNWCRIDFVPGKNKRRIAINDPAFQFAVQVVIPYLTTGGICSMPQVATSLQGDAERLSLGRAS